MPFTLSHTVLAIPFKNKSLSKYFNFTALVLGSMAPDFEYYIKISTHDTWNGHSLSAIFYLNVPLILLFSIIFHHIIKGSLILMLPNSVYPYFSKYSLTKPDIFSAKGMIIFLYSAILGDLSHLFLDSFTHLQGFFVEHFSVLRMNTFFYNMMVFEILQHLLSVIFFIILILFLAKNKKVSLNYKNTSNSKILYWPFVIIIFVIFFVVKFVYYPSLEEIAIEAFIVFISAVAFSVFCGALFLIFFIQLEIVLTYEKSPKKSQKEMDSRLNL